LELKAEMKPVLIIGATGNVGRQVVSQLMPRDVRIRAMSRNPDAAALPPEVGSVARRSLQS
jgi:uncharacterized protein YbjT (DUF2867 family)